MRRWIAGSLLAMAALPAQQPEATAPTVQLLAKDLAAAPEDTRRLVLAGPEDGDLPHLARLTLLEHLEINASHELGTSRRATVAITDAGLLHLTALTRLRSLQLRDCEKLTGRGLRHLSALPILEELSLGSCRLEGEALAELRRLPALRRLDLRGTQGLSMVSLAALAQVQSLEELDLSGHFGLRSEELLALGGLRRLRVLHLDKVNGLWPMSSRRPPPELQVCGVDDAVLGALGKLAHLEELRLGQCSKVTAAGLAHLAALPRLRVLDLSQCGGVGDALLAQLPPGLEVLGLYGCTDLTGAGLERLEGLRVLDLSRSAVTDEAVARLPPGLTDLDLSGCKVLTPAVTAHLVRLTRLRRLALSFLPKLTDAALEPLAKLAELRRLELMGVVGGNLGLGHLAALPHLEELILTNNIRVRHDGVAKLAALPLRRLDLGGCRLITAPQAVELAALWPEAEVIEPRTRRLIGR